MPSEKSPYPKTWDDKRKERLRKAYLTGSASVKEIAAAFGTSAGRVFQIAKKEGWPLRGLRA